MKVIVSIAVLLLLFFVLQCWNPPIDGPAVTGGLQAPPEVMAILDRACADCHSNANRLHWYDKIAPASWLVNADIREARTRYNLSTWDSLKPGEQQAELWEMVNMIIDGKMPPGVYAFMHPGAKVSPVEVEMLKKYLASLDRFKRGDTASIAAADREFAASAAGRAAGEPVAADGVRYIDGFADWQVISTTNRFDNHSIRIIFGNAPVVQAIKDGQVRSFPDGSVLVKAVWNSIEDAEGHVRPGTVNSIQIMIKDEKRFPKTAGWGFAKFNGIKLVPCGADATFNTTCFNCHKMAGDFGYVFNIPPTRELFDAGEQRVITSFADNRQQTMSTLYGNGSARRAAVAGVGAQLSHDAGLVPGAIYTLVTWGQVKNTYWYGSQINGPLLSIERVSVSPDSAIDYKVLRGTVRGDSVRQVTDTSSRVKLILGRRASVLP